MEAGGFEELNIKMSGETHERGWNTPGVRWRQRQGQEEEPEGNLPREEGKPGAVVFPRPWWKERVSKR